MKKSVWLVALLLCCSNTFMNTAWYGHLKFKESPLWAAIFASWGIAFFEYCLQVPANRIGEGMLTLTQLKVMQEFFSITTFAVFSLIVFKEKLTVNHGLSFFFILLAAYFAVKK